MYMDITGFAVKLDSRSALSPLASCLYWESMGFPLNYPPEALDLNSPYSYYIRINLYLPKRGIWTKE